MSSSIDDRAFVMDVANRLGFAFMIRDMNLKQICQTVLHFTHGRVPSSPEQLRAELETSYASLLVDVTGKLSTDDEVRLLRILKRYAKLN